LGDTLDQLTLVWKCGEVDGQQQQPINVTISAIVNSIEGRCHQSNHSSGTAADIDLLALDLLNRSAQP
jgi:hypothetical protein